MIKFNRDQNFIALFYSLFSVFLASTSFGINSIAFPAVLVKNDIAPFMVGLASTTEVIAGVIIAIFLSRIIARFSIIKTTIFLGLLYTISILLIYFYQNFSLWLAFCIINGICFFALVVIRQVWINNLATTSNRSIILALITTTLCVGFICGSFVVKYFGALNYVCFALSSLSILVSAAIFLLIHKTKPREIDSQRIGIIEFFKHNPRIALAKLLIDLQMGCIVTLTVIFGNKIGISAENAGLLIGAFMASGMCDLYAGFMVQKYDRYKMIKTGFICCLISAVVMAIFSGSYNLLLLFFFLFGVSTAFVFVSSVTVTNESFSKEKLVAANATFQSLGSIGSLLGSFVGGVLIQIFDYWGFFISLIIANLVYLGFSGFYEFKMRIKQ